MASTMTVGSITMNNLTGSFMFGEWQDDGVQWDRDIVTAPWVNYRYIISARKRVVTLTGELYVVTNGSAASHKSAENTLLAQLAKPVYTITISTEGTSRSFQCEMADVERGESIQSALFNNWTTFVCTVPCRPIS